MLEGAAHRARGVIDQGRGQLGDHPVDPIAPQRVGLLAKLHRTLSGLQVGAGQPLQLDPELQPGLLGRHRLGGALGDDARVRQLDGRCSR